MKKNFLNKINGFTLIELLVVVAIIGTLSGVVVFAISSSREKANEKAISSNLRNIINSTEIYITENNTYPNSVNCQTVYSDAITALNKLNTSSRCYAFYPAAGWGFSSRVNNDVNKNYSVDSSGVVIWDLDTKSGFTLNWANANTHCSNLGGKLPSYDQFYSLRSAYQGETNRPNFGNLSFWTSTSQASNPNSAHVINFEGGVGTISKTSTTRYAVCVKPIK